MVGEVGLLSRYAVSCPRFVPDDLSALPGHPLPSPILSGDILAATALRDSGLS
jgi:hypothetical protein